ncbi:unnamed protein product [Caenorhabditis bovis]|uniref:Uncharacterized protein n=1 Tax=Caenorhabditis bovis TaxID=2654633 RepID=A0A8S1FDV4_9PELO|nr:unnamed protein product [Caenorhabditis bovis]
MIVGGDYLKCQKEVGKIESEHDIDRIITPEWPCRELSIIERRRIFGAKFDEYEAKFRQKNERQIIEYRRMKNLENNHKLDDILYKNGEMNTTELPIQETTVPIKENKRTLANRCRYEMDRLKLVNITETEDAIDRLFRSDGPCRLISKHDRIRFIGKERAAYFESISNLTNLTSAHLQRFSYMPSGGHRHKRSITKSSSLDLFTSSLALTILRC